MSIAAGLGFGVLALILGADWLVNGAVRIAALLRISPLVVGLTVVAFGTSTPELAVTVQAAFSGSPDIAIGNIIGSNIQNLMLVLGLSAMFASLRVAPRILKIDMPLLLILSGVMIAMASDGVIGKSDGLMLISGLLVYAVLAIRQGRAASTSLNSVSKDNSSESGSLNEGGHDSPSRLKVLLTSVPQAIAGLILLSAGGNMFVSAASTLASLCGMSELAIGVTVVAFGTSLPEIVTCVLATVRGHRDMAVGNVVGSNIFNILCVLGISSCISPDGLAISPSIVAFDLPLMLAVTTLCFIVCLTGSRIVRGEGLLLLLIFAAYAGWLITSTPGELSLSHPPVLIGAVLALTLICFQIYGLTRPSIISERRVLCGKHRTTANSTVAS